MITIGMLGNVALMLLLTLSFVFLLAFILKQFKKIAPQFPGNLQVLGGTNLGGKSKIVLIQAYNTQILVGVSDTHIQTLHVFHKVQNEQINNTIQAKE